MNLPRNHDMTELKRVHITVSGRIRVHTHEHMRIDLIPGPIEHELTPFINEFEDHIEITGKAPGRWFQTSNINIDIWLPKMTVLTLDCSGGDFDIEGEYESVNARVKAGEVRWNVNENTRGEVRMWFGKATMKYRQNDQINFSKNRTMDKVISLNDSENQVKCSVFMGDVQVEQLLVQ